jgi:peptidoglycan hydrolase-like protein with peptidoglycan-binding domain
MAAIPAYEDWIKNTSSLGSPRSNFLKALDDAIKTRDEARIKTAFDRWRFEQSRQGKDWKQSVRNKTGAVTALFRTFQLPQAPSKEERQAMEYIRREQQMALMRQFQRTKVAFKTDTLGSVVSGNASTFSKIKMAAQGAGVVKNVVTTTSNLVGGANGNSGPIAQIKEKLMQAIVDLCPNLDISPDTVLRQIGLPGVAEFVKQAAPILGSIKSGLKAAQAWGEVAKTGNQKYKLSQARYAIAKGDPEGALNAIGVILNRELASTTVAATSATVSFSLQTAGLFADMGGATGPAVAAAQLIAELLQSIYEFVRDYKEVQRANSLLRMGALNLEIFETCPLLGCYFLAVQDHSTVIAFAVDEFGTANWKFDVERMVKSLTPVLESSRRMIQASKFELVGVRIDDKTAEIMLISLQDQKGLVSQNYSVKTGLDKALSFPDHVKEQLTERFMSAIGKGTAPKGPVFDKSRIQGFGSVGTGGLGVF